MRHPLRSLVAALAAAAIVVPAPVARVGAAPPTPTPRAVAPLDNPTVDDSCGIDVTLLLDASGSIGSSEDEVRGAGEAFLDALADTSSTARVLDFGTVARETAPATLVTSESVAPGGVHRQALDAYYHPKPPLQPGVTGHRYSGGDPQSESSYRTGSDPQYTNWDQALDLAGDEPDELVVFLTDGEPTALDSDQPGDPFHSAGQDPPDVRYGTDGSSAARDLTLDRAVEEANAAKLGGARVLAVGAGSAFTSSDAVTRLKAVSGPQVAYDAQDITDLNSVDVALIEDFDELAVALRRVVTQLCSPSLTIRKLAQTPDDPAYQPAEGWDMTVEPVVSTAEDPPYRWILPTAGAPVGPQSATTDDDGFAGFQWEPDPATSSSVATVTEAVEPGYVPRDYSCQSKQGDGTVTTTEGPLDPDDPTFALPVGPESIVTCTLRNDFTYEPGIAITKVNDPPLVRGDGGGETVTSTYEVSNTGNAPMALTTPVDDRCAGVTYVSGDVPPTNSLLDVDETWTYTCDRVVQSALTDQPVNVVNTVTVAGRDPEGTLRTATAQDDVDVITPDIVIDKSVDQTVVLPGTPVTYTYAVRTDGNVGLTGVAPTDDTCAPLTYQAGDGGTVGSLEPGEVWTYTCGATIDVETLNTVTVEGTPPRGAVVQDSDTALVRVDDPDLRLTKDVSDDQVFPGTPVDYTFVVTNPSQSILEPVPDRAGFVQDDRCPPVYDSGDVGDDEILGPGESWTYRCDGVAIGDDTLNIARVDAYDAEVDVTLTRRAAALVEVLTPQIAIQKVVSDPVIYSGDDVTYTYEVTNPGATDIDGTFVTDDRCAPVTYTGGDDGDGLLQPGELWTYECTATLTKGDPSGPPETVVNTADVVGTATLDGVTGRQVTDRDTAEVLLIEPVLTLVKEADATEVRVGRPVTWTVTITNTGDSPLVYLAEADTDCNPLTYQSGDVGDDGVADVGEAWVYTCTEPLFEDRTNTAGVIGLDVLGGTLVASDPATVTVYDADIDLEKSVDPQLLPEGEVATYTFVVTNPGTDPLTDVGIADTDCDPLTFQSGDDGGDGVLTPGEVWTYTCTATIDTAGVNVAVVLGRDHLGLPVVAGSAAAVVPYRAGIAVQKSAEPTALVGSGEVTYSYAVTNTGDVPLADVVDQITDDTCAPVTYVGGDDDGNGLLTGEGDLFETGPPETWTFTCATTVDRDTTNTVTVTGDPVRPEAGGLTPLGPAVTASDTATVVVTVPPTTPPTDPTDPTDPDGPRPPAVDPAGGDRPVGPAAVGLTDLRGDGPGDVGSDTSPSGSPGALALTGAGLARLLALALALGLGGLVALRARRRLAGG
ncbi:hypothetical protein PO878_10215 [Iamia majanohamensis]|uniref:VWFA domain-containing protein n=1 Tax=Iamia majanohamensis TaxID=467976 RepID=A0AAF0BXR9_9ACTN|nr:hypothetical protein [Iamia majanohamensis]WCO69099.1 hypothetical protein PO878_10215 [Iamia majanohamensis]